MEYLFGEFKQTEVKSDTCEVEFINHIDCQYSLKKVGFYIDTINSVMLGKSHIHEWIYNNVLQYGCWYDDTFYYPQLQNPTFSCGNCGDSDSVIITEFYYQPSYSNTIKFFSVNDGSAFGHILFDYRDRYNYEVKFGFVFPQTLDEPFCCTPNSTTPLVCQTCNCGVGIVNWQNKEFGIKPARGIFWNNECNQTYDVDD